MIVRSGSVFAFFVMVAGSAWADDPRDPASAPRSDRAASADATSSAAAKPRAPRRRVERHEQERSAATKGRRKVHQIDTVIVYGRPQKPLAAVETSAQPLRFPVGTVRYSERDRRFLKAGERW
jgi:hypothetical protein